MISYRQRERAALRELALSVYADPKAPRDHRLAARDRLVADDRELDIANLDGAEQSALENLLRVARGDSRSDILAEQEAERLAASAPVSTDVVPERPAPRIAIAERAAPTAKPTTSPPGPNATADEWRDYATAIVRAR